MVTNNVTVYQFEVGLDEVFADEVRFQTLVFIPHFRKIMPEVKESGPCYNS